MDVQHGDPVNQPKTIRLIACPSLAYEHGKIDRYVEAGATVAEHLRAIGWDPAHLHARVFIDDQLIEQAQWEYAVPRAGQAFITRVIPGAGGGKDALRIVAMLGVVALALAAPYLIGTYAGLGGALFITTPGMGALSSAAITIAGSLAITARMPPARPRLRDQRSVQHG